MRPPVVLTIAGSDPSGSSGIQADLPTFAALGAHGTSVVTVVTAQDSHRVNAFHELPLELVRAQLEAVVDDLAPIATKTGMLRSPELIDLVGDYAADSRLGTLVVDPVMVDSAGTPIVDVEAIAAYRRLAAHGAIITPNRWEAELLADLSLDERGVDALSATLLGLGSDTVVITGGRGEGDQVEDVVASPGGVEVIGGPRIGTEPIRGTGCTFSAALVAAVSVGVEPPRAVKMAQSFVREQLMRTEYVRLGSGRPGVPHVVGMESL